jgi:hypothetical protein
MRIKFFRFDDLPQSACHKVRLEPNLDEGRERNLQLKGENGRNEIDV